MLMKNYFDLLNRYKDLIVNNSEVRKAFKDLTEGQKTSIIDFINSFGKIFYANFPEWKKEDFVKNDNSETKVSVTGVKVKLDENGNRVYERIPDATFTFDDKNINVVDFISSILGYNKEHTCLCDECNCSEKENVCSCQQEEKKQECDCQNQEVKMSSLNDFDFDSVENEENREPETLAEELLNELEEQELKKKEDKSEIIEKLVQKIVDPLYDKVNKPYKLHKRDEETGTLPSVEVCIADNMDEYNTYKLEDEEICDSVIKRVMQLTGCKGVTFRENSDESSDSISAFLTLDV